MKSPIAAAKTGATSVLSEWRHHPIAMLVAGLVFGAFVFPFIAGLLGRFKAASPTLGAVIPGSFTRAG